MTGDPEELAERRDAEKLDLLRKRLLSSVKKLRQSQLTMLQAEIIDRLIDGKRTATELAHEIFQANPGDEGFQANYAKIRRDLKELEIRGYASTNLFGRDKHYRLTRNGVAMLSSILPEMGETRLVGIWDLGIFVATASAAVLLISARHSNQPTLYALFAVFFALLGISISAFARILRKVI